MNLYSGLPWIIFPCTQLMFLHLTLVGGEAVLLLFLHTHVFFLWQSFEANYDFGIKNDQ